MKYFILAARPKTLVAAFIPPVVAHALYVCISTESSYYLMWMCVLTALFIQLATNFYNDAIDFVKGADEVRVGPARVTSMGVSSYKQVMYWGHGCLLLAAIFATPLIIKGGVVILVLGLLSIYLTYGYTGGPYPLAYKGLGELFVFLFFGLVAVVGSYFIYSGTVSTDAFVLGSQIGLLSCVLIAVNNFRDRLEDVKVEKRTLATKMSTHSYLMMMDAFLFLPYILNFYFFFKYKMSFIFVILAMPVAHKIRKIMHEHIELNEMNEALKFGGIHLLLFGVLFTMGCLWSH